MSDKHTDPRSMSNSDKFGLDPLLERSLAGDTQAWEDLLGKIRPYLYYRVRALLGPRPCSQLDESSLVQRSLLKIHENFGQLRHPQRPQFLKWVRKIVYHIVCDGFRRLERQPVHLGSRVFPLPSNRAAEAEQHERDDLMIWLAEALSQLPDHKRQVIEWRFLDQLPDAEIARRLGGSTRAVRVLRHRAIEDLRRRAIQELEQCAVQKLHQRRKEETDEAQR